MLEFQLGKEAGAKLKILCLGAHCDDIEIGCGGTLQKLLDQNDDIQLKWVVFSSSEVRKQEAINSASNYLKSNGSIEILDFRNGFFPYYAIEIKEYFETIKNSFNPDIVFTHFQGDKHQDHKLVSDLTFNTFRNHLILQYEIAKYDGDLRTPNIYSIIDKKFVDKKINLLMNCFKSQSSKHWFTQDLFRSLMRVRGIECASQTGFAEGFHSNKLTF